MACIYRHDATQPLDTQLDHTYTNHHRLLPPSPRTSSGRGDVRLRATILGLARLDQLAPLMDRQEGDRKRAREGEEESTGRRRQQQQLQVNAVAFAETTEAPGPVAAAEAPAPAPAAGGEGAAWQRPEGVFDLPWQKCRGGLGVASGGWELRDVFFRSLVDGRAAAIGVPGDRLSPPPSKWTLFDDVDAWLAAAGDGEVDPLWRSVLGGPRPA